MGTKRPSWTIYDTVPNIKMSERKLQPGGKISRDPSPRPAMTAQTERERDSSREDEWRRDQDGDKRREKERYKESTEQPHGRYYDRGLRTWDGKRDRQQETRNVRPLSNIEKENEKEGDRGVSKGDTFPRGARGHLDHGQIMMTTAMGEDREDRSQRRREDRERDRDRPREREEYRIKTKDEGKGTRNERARDRYREFEDRRRDVGGDDKRDRYAPRKNDKQRDMGPRKPRMSSPEQQRDRNKYWDKAQRRDGKRDTRSEGEIDERVWSKEQVRDRDELIYQHSRSEGDTRSENDRERREYYRPQDRYRDKEDRLREDRYIANRENERRTAWHREGNRQMKSGQDDRRHEDRYSDRDYKQRIARDRIRETDRAGMSSQSQSNVTPRVPPRAQSSGEWSSDMDGEMKVRRDQDGRDRKEKHRHREPKRDRKMWLEPQRGPANRDATSAEELEDRETRSKKSVIEGCSSEDTEGVSVDGEMEEMVREDSEDNTEDSEGGSDPGWIQNKERILSGEDGFVTVSSGGDDEEDREEDFKDCMEIWERDKDTDEEWTMGKEETVDDEDIIEGEERDTPPKYVFCVIGQTVPQEDNSNTQAKVQNDTDQSFSHEYDEVREIEETLTSGDPAAVDGVKMGSNSYNELGTMKRDSQTEKLLMQWREKNKEQNEEERGNISPIPSNPYADVPVQLPYEQIQSTLDQRISGAISPEEEEVIRIRMSGAWSISEEPKRHSQAPHLKWAKSVVREILGQSDEKIDNSEPEESKGEIQDEENPKIKTDGGHSEPELEEDEEELFEVEGLRGMGQSQADMHADLGTAMHGYTPTHTNTKSDTESKEEDQVIPLVQVDTEVKMCNEAMQIEVEQTNDDKEAEMYLSVSNTLYKPNSCPSLNCEPESDILETKGPLVVVSCYEEQVEEDRESTELVIEEENTEEENTEGKDDVDERRVGGATLMSSCSLRGVGSHRRKGGFRRTTQRRKEGPVKKEDEEQEEGVGRDRRTRIFSTSDDEDIRSKSLGEVDLRSVLDSIRRKKRNSKIFIPDAAQLYQQYSEAAQNFEILRQFRSDVVSVCEGSNSSPVSSPPPARRPLPPLPLVPHPHSLSHTSSFTSVQSLPLPGPQWKQHRGSLPQLSVSLTQSATLWRDLPAVRNSPELQKLTEDQRRLQEVRFEVVTSEASYCRSLDIVVEHFVKSKHLGALLTTQDRNWLFSRLADVRAISHSFLSKLEEKVESDIMNFTVCDVIARHCVTFKMVYVPYLTNQSYQDATYQRLMNENQGFRQIVEKLERSPRCQRLPLRSFLVLPFQRITRIKLLVQNIVKRTTPGTAEATQAIKALKQLEKLIQESNDSITQMKSIESLVSLSAKVDFITECRTLPLISQSRRLVREGKVTELMDFSSKETERSVYLHLFNDYLLLSLQKEGGRFTVIDHSPVSELRAENCRVKLHSLQKNLFRLHMSHNALLLRTDTQSDKLRWISALSRPHTEVDFSAAQDDPQMQCIRAFVAQQPDELSLEKADIILVHQQSSDHWVEGTRLSDRHRGWVPESHLETISIPEIRKRNLSDALRLTTATAQV